MESPGQQRSQCIPAVLLAAGLVVAWQVREILLLLFGGIVLGVVLKRLKHYVQKNTGWPHAVSMLVLVLVFAGGLVVACSLVANPLMSQTRSLIESLPEIWQGLERRLASHPWLSDWWSRNQDEVEGSVSERSAEGVGWIVSMLRGMVTLSVGLVIGLVAVLAVGLYLAVEPRLYIAGMVHLVPMPWEGKVRQTLDRCGDIITGWLVGQLFSMACVGVCITVGLWLLGVPHSLALGVIAGLFAFVPNLGPIAAFFPTIFVALGEDPMLAVWAAILYIGVQTLEGNFITPLFQERIIAMPPALLLGFQLLMGAWAGLAGLLVAAPLLATLMALSECLYVETILGKSRSSAEASES